MDHIVFLQRLKATKEVEPNEAARTFPYELEIFFSLVVCGFLYCLVLIVKINYGDMVITHITLRPYKIGLMIITCFLVYFVLLLSLQNLGTKEDVLSYLVDYDIYFIIGWTLVGLKYSLFLIFILARIFEHATLLIFIDFQQALSLQNLEIARDKYKSIEKFFQRSFYVSCIVVSVP